LISRAFPSKSIFDNNCVVVDDFDEHMFIRSVKGEKIMEGLL
jgi:hypothetical protein